MGAIGETRTHTVTVLSRVPLPLDYDGLLVLFVPNVWWGSRTRTLPVSFLRQMSLPIGLHPPEGEWWPGRDFNPQHSHSECDASTYWTTRPGRILQRELLSVSQDGIEPSHRVSETQVRSVCCDKRHLQKELNLHSMVRSHGADPSVEVVGKNLC